MLTTATLLLALVSGVLELRVQIGPPMTTLRAGDTSRAVTLLGRAAKPGTMRRERRPELGPHQLVIVVVDEAGTQLDWRSIADPRVVRVESADASGRLSGQVITNPSAEFTLRVPDIPGAARVRIFQTITGDDGFALAAVGEVRLR